jgi:protocatechuate 3,4-dioxygenase beta subunit
MCRLMNSLPTTPTLVSPRTGAAQAGSSSARPTPPLPLGPFYPLDVPSGMRSALWHGGPLPQGVRELCLQGTVQTIEGRGVSGALVEIWHADPAGRYRHPSAPDVDRVLAGFTGHGRVVTDDRGGFTFTSIVPGGYASREGLPPRAPHVHVQITGQVDRVVTQLFLPGHADNTGDRWFHASSNPQALTPDLVSDDDAQFVLRWTAVLMRG